jgi:hypothetical protein
MVAPARIDLEQLRQRWKRANVDVGLDAVVGKPLPVLRGALALPRRGGRGRHELRVQVHHDHTRTIRRAAVAGGHRHGEGAPCAFERRGNHVDRRVSPAGRRGLAGIFVHACSVGRPALQSP